MQNKTAGTLMALATLWVSANLLADVTFESRDSHATEFMQDSTITAQVTALLAGDRLTRRGHIQVESERNGVVWLTGTARSQEGVDQAGAIARATEGVRLVHNDVVVLAQD